MDHPNPAASQPVARVLLVEDEPDTLARVKGMLEACNCDVLAADNPDQAIRLFQSGGRVDVLLTGVSLPRINGVMLSERLRKARPDLKVLYMSGFFEDAIERHYGVNVAGEPFLHIPFSREALEQCLAELLTVEPQEEGK